MKVQCRFSSFILFRTAFFAVVITVLYACGRTDNVGTERDPFADASYKVTFTTSWTVADFPTKFPAGAHFSKLVGGTHNDQVKFWEDGQIATAGIESMAETGSKSGLASEVSAAKTDGKAEFILGGAGNSAAGTTTLEFDINEMYSLVTLVSMVAPSPDWFVGVRDLSLFDNATGAWKQTVVVDLAVYDAGTDSGAGFAAADADTRPAEPVSLLSTNPVDTDFVNGVGQGGRFATMTFERIK